MTATMAFWPAGMSCKIRQNDVDRNPLSKQNMSKRPLHILKVGVKDRRTGIPSNRWTEGVSDWVGYRDAPRFYIVIKDDLDFEP